MIEEILIPLIIFTAIFGIVFVVISARNRERMAMIEKDIHPKEFITPRTSNTYGVLKWALLLVGLGFGIFIGSLLESYTRVHEVPAYFATALFFGGLGLFLAFLLTRKAEDKI